jgi:hypothetical protein
VRRVDRSTRNAFLNSDAGKAKNMAYKPANANA